LRWSDVTVQPSREVESVVKEVRLFDLPCDRRPARREAEHLENQWNEFSLLTGDASHPLTGLGFLVGLATSFREEILTYLSFAANRD